jgi:hypothetical protein
MAQSFIITGLPRSRTAWFAAVCNTIPEAICWHEPMAWCADWAALQRLLDTSVYQYAGISDSLAGFHLSDLARATAARVLIVQRDPGQVAASLAGLFPGVDVPLFLAVLGGRLKRVGSDPSVRVVAYDDLTSARVVCGALRWLMPEATICAEKVAELNRLNVQADMERVQREAASAGDRRVDLFGAETLAELAG